ncbi:pyruvate decarboxylase-like protein [Leptodontidium sp. MPI-SDFR-AT-0119]|nr:pyruvate decarboxylase-like protein [Leptodontidium sp. MPI-SDFR-AT-0119]
MATTITLADFLFARLYQLGLRSLHGVPGDYNLVALDYVEKSGLKWVGNCNELNAGYAADGYARVNGIGAIFTVIGVGELSAINACAGSYAENIPVVYLVGSPSRAAHQNKAILHHTLGDGDFDAFADMFKRVTVAQAKLMDINTAAQEIDRVLEACWRLRRPVYIRLPTDMVTQKLDATLLDTPLGLEPLSNKVEAESAIVDKILDLLHEAKNPVFLVDANASRFRVLDEVDVLVRKSGLPTFIAPMGKSTINESLENFSGMYFGAFTDTKTREAFESSDLVLYIGPIKSDVNTAWFTTKLRQEKTVEFHSDRIEIGFAKYEGIQMKGVLQKLGARIERSPPHSPKLDVSSTSEVPAAVLGEQVPEPILHKHLWKRLSSWLQPNDVIITENGTANIGIWDSKFPPSVQAINQTLWGSIGYSVGAAQGAALALKDAGSESRTVLFVGDGSFQLTAQEVSTMIRLKLRVIIFLIENEGYTIERFIHGMEAEYNDIAGWKYTDIPRVLGASESDVGIHDIETKAELETLLLDRNFAEARNIQFVEMHMPKDDAPEMLKAVGEGAAKSNSRDK